MLQDWNLVTYPPEDRWNDWQRWFDRALNDVQALCAHRAIWKNLLRMFEANPNIKHDQNVHTWLRNGYVTTIAVGTRRQCDAEGRRPTIACLLKEVSRYPDIVTFERFATNISDLQGAQTYWAEFSNLCGNHLDGDIPKRHEAILNEQVKTVRNYVNANLAHRQKGVAPKPVTLTFPDLDQALDTLAGIASEYYGLFKPGCSLAWVTPDVRNGWERMFDTPWLSPAYKALSPEDFI